MKKRSDVFALAMAMIVVAAAAYYHADAWAWRGNGQGPAPCMLYDTSNSEVVTVTGVVKRSGPGTGGMVVDDGTQVVTVYGIGPVWYWRSLGIARPGIGDKVTVEAYSVELSNGSYRLIAKAVTVGQGYIELRDGVSGRPAWWMQGRGRKGGLSGCPYNMNRR